jgi:hypothetical protein
VRAALNIEIVRHTKLRRYNDAVPWTSRKIRLHVSTRSRSIRVYNATSTVLDVDQYAHWPDHIPHAQRPSRCRLAHDHDHLSPTSLLSNLIPPHSSRQKHVPRIRLLLAPAHLRQRLAQLVRCSLYLHLHDIQSNRVIVSSTAIRKSRVSSASTDST